MKIYAPVSDATGTWCSVRFHKGVGETDNPRLIEWFKSHGYRVEETKEVIVANIDNVMDEVLETAEEVPEKTLEEMNPNELREWARTNGYGGKIKNTRNKDKLLEIIREG